MDEREITVANIMVEMAAGSPTDKPLPFKKRFRSVQQAEAANGSSSSWKYHNSPQEPGLVAKPESMQQQTKIRRFESSMIRRLLSALRYVLVSPQEGVNIGSNSLTIHQIVDLVRLKNPEDPSIHEMEELLIVELIRKFLKVLASSAAPPGAVDWMPLVRFEKISRRWSWIGPIPPVNPSQDGTMGGNITLTSWGIPPKTIWKLAAYVSGWLKRSEETLRKIASLPPPPAVLLQPINMVERFKGVGHKKSLTTIDPSPEDVRAYFRREEALRYSIPDRAFSYTAIDGKKSTVAPLWSMNKARKHPLLKDHRPHSFTILCLVRDAAARLPGGLGTRDDICVLMRDSGFITNEIFDDKVISMVTSTLNKLKSDDDPCVTFDTKKHVWLYLHGDREDEDFLHEDTACTETRVHAD